MLPSARPWNSTCKLFASASTARSPPCACLHRHGAVLPGRLLDDVDMFDELNLAALVLDDVVAAQSVAVFVERIVALDALPVLQREDCLADIVRLGAFPGIHGRGDHIERVVGPT